MKSAREEKPPFPMNLLWPSIACAAGIVLILSAARLQQSQQQQHDSMMRNQVTTFVVALACTYVTLWVSTSGDACGGDVVTAALENIQLGDPDF
jgi:cell division protein FtsW (lipid II flippase)